MVQNFNNIPGSQRVLAALEKLEERPTAPVTAVAASTESANEQTLFELAALKDENRRMKNDKQQVAKRLGKLIKTVEAWPEQ